MISIVTGGAGFIGSNLVDELVKLNHKVIVIDNFSTGKIDNIIHLKNQIEIVDSDIGQKGDWQKYFKDAKYVYHLAALADIVPSIQNPSSYYHSNVTGTLNVLEACRTGDIKKLIYSASSSCYGIPNTYPTKETEDLRPEYPYALTKKLGEDLVLHWSKVYKVPVISLRFFNVYGLRARTSGTYGAVFGVFLSQKIAGKPFTIVGDGTQTRDFTFVSDVCNAIIAAANSDIENKIFNIGSGKTVSINYIADLLKGEKIYIPKRPGEPESTFADISKIQKYLNWEPKIKIEDGVKILIDNINLWKNAPLWEPKTIKEATKDWFKYLK